MIRLQRQRIYLARHHIHHIIACLEKHSVIGAGLRLRREPVVIPRAVARWNLMLTGQWTGVCSTGGLTRNEKRVLGLMELFEPPKREGKGPGQSEGKWHCHPLLHCRLRHLLARVVVCQPRLSSAHGAKVAL